MNPDRTDWTYGLSRPQLFVPPKRTIVFREPMKVEKIDEFALHGIISVYLNIHLTIGLWIKSMSVLRPFFGYTSITNHKDESYKITAPLNGSMIPSPTDDYEAAVSSDVIERSVDFPTFVFAKNLNKSYDGRSMFAEQLFMIFHDNTSYGESMDIATVKRKEGPCVIMVNNYSEERDSNGLVHTYDFNDGIVSFYNSQMPPRPYRIDGPDRFDIFSKKFFRDSQDELDFLVQDDY